MLETVFVRPIGDADWPHLAALEHTSYGPLGLSEGQNALETWGALSPRTCFVLGAPGEVRAYVLSMPFRYGGYPELGTSTGVWTGSPNLHLHDLSVAPAFRRTGLGRHLVEHLTSVARSLSYHRISLIALSGTFPFWSSNGFRPDPAVPAPTGYGANARYLTKVL
ncbi:GNAT family N-acetyltransferase [Kribbella sp. NPDC058245]|uniref:GNAT family N-acetyltransferase n=1 Tax=Kribbella sp. NPDC058245 TaxID=3346399 RepID=UPI0036EA2CED